jgi:hypothetical protein
MIASFLHHKIERKKKIMRERERERERETMQPSFGPTFWGMLTKCYLLWTSQLCKCEFISLGNSQNISYFNWWSIELANKEESRRTLIALWWWAAPCSSDCFCMAAWLPGVRARSVVVRERERDTHTHVICYDLWLMPKKHITVLRSWVLLKFASHDECAFWEC